MGTEEHTVVERFVVKDEGSATVEMIGKTLEYAAEKAKETRERFGELRRESGLTAGALLGVGAGLGAWIEKTREVNKEFMQTNRMLSGLFATSLTWGKNVDFVDRYAVASRLAGEQTEELEKIAGRFGGSLGEVGEQYHQLAQELGPLGLSREKMTELATNVRATAKVIGVDAAGLIEKISSAAITKTFSKRGEAGKFLLQALGGGSLQHLRPEQIIAKIYAAMGRLTPAADKMSQGIGDSLNRIHLAVDSLLRAATTPLFNEIGKTLSGWAKSLTDASGGVKPLAEVYGEKLVAWFRELKELASTLLDHWKEIAVVWGGLKVGGAMRGIGGAVAGVGAEGGALEKVGGFVGKLGLATEALTAFYFGVKAFTDWWESQQDKRRHEAATTVGGGGTIAAAVKAIVGGRAKEARGNLAGFMSSSGQVDVGALTTTLKAAEKSDLVSIGKAMGIQPQTFGLGQVNTYDPAALAQGIAAQLTALTAKGGGDPLAMKQLNPVEVMMNQLTPDMFAKLKIDQHIGAVNITQKFEDADPDRVFLRFKEDLEEVGRRPSGSVHSEPLGI